MRTFRFGWASFGGERGVSCGGSRNNAQSLELMLRNAKTPAASSSCGGLFVVRFRFRYAIGRPPLVMTSATRSRPRRSTGTERRRASPSIDGTPRASSRSADPRAESAWGRCPRSALRDDITKGKMSTLTQRVKRYGCVRGIFCGLMARCERSHEPLDRAMLRRVTKSDALRGLRGGPTLRPGDPCAPSSASSTSRRSRAAARARPATCRRRQRHRGPDWSGIYADERADPRPRAARHRRRRSAARSRCYGADRSRTRSRSTARSTTTASCEQALRVLSVPDRLRLRGASSRSTREHGAGLPRPSSTASSRSCSYDARARPLPHRPRPDRRGAALHGARRARQRCSSPPR